MKLISAYIENFGCISGQKFDFQEGLTVICRENGWGKTTLAAFVKAMLYGMPVSRVKDLYENERQRYRPWQGGRYGGSLTFSVGKMRYRVERTFADKESADVFALYDDVTNLPSDDYTAKLGEELFSVDAEGFERSTCFSERSDRVKPDYTDIQARLVNLQDFEDCDKALKRLQERRKYYKMTGQRGRIAELENRRYTATEELRSALQATAAYEEGERAARALAEEQQQLIRRQEALSHELQATSDEKLRLAHAEQARQLRARIGEMEKELTSLTTPALPGEPLLAEIEAVCNRLKATAQVEEQARTQAIIRQQVAAEQHAKQLSDMETIAETAIKNEAEAWNVLRRCRAFPYFALLLCAVGATAFFLVPSPALSLICGIVCILCAAALFGLYLRARMYLNRKTAIRHEKEEELAALRAEERDDTGENAASPSSADLPAQTADDRRVLAAFLADYAPDLAPDSDPDRALLCISVLRTKAAQAAALAQRIRSAKNEYNTFLSDHPDLTRPRDAARAEETVRAEYKACRDRLEVLIGELRRTEQQNAPLLHRAERAPALRQEIADIEETLPRYRRRLAVTVKAMEYLTKAKEALTAGYLDRVQERFSAYVSEIGQLDPEIAARTYRLSPAFEVTVDSGGATHPGAMVSRGTRDLLALCLRLALRDAVFSGEQPPLLLDDPFTAYDDKRTQKALAFLHKLAEKEQIVYLVCHTARA